MVYLSKKIMLPQGLLNSFFFDILISDYAVNKIHQFEFEEGHDHESVTR